MNWWILVGVYLLIMIGVFIYGLTVKDDSLAYHMRKFSVEIDNLKRIITGELMPAFEKANTQIQKFIDVWNKGKSK